VGRETREHSSWPTAGTPSRVLVSRALAGDRKAPRPLVRSDRSRPKDTREAGRLQAATNVSVARETRLRRRHAAPSNPSHTLRLGDFSSSVIAPIRVLTRSSDRHRRGPGQAREALPAAPQWVNAHPRRRTAVVAVRVAAPPDASLARSDPIQAARRPPIASRVWPGDPAHLHQRLVNRSQRWRCPA